MGTVTPDLKSARRIVVKIGSALLVDPASGRLNDAWLTALAGDLARLRARGQEVIVVSSGSIALGRRILGLKQGSLNLTHAQAAAATGQIELARAYRHALEQHETEVAQILLTLDDTETRRRYLNARATISTLLQLGVVPVINENDTVATSEIRFGDNDRLAARVAVMTGADNLVLLSDVDGLYTADPLKNPDAGHIARIDAITPEIEAMAGLTRTEVGSGGMVTKLMAGKIALAGGCHMVITDGRMSAALSALEDGARASWFVAAKTPQAARKQWIAGTLKPAGCLTVDDGAARALARGNSLLPAGVTGVAGNFEKGDAVTVADSAGSELARGLSAYSADDARRIIGHNSRDIEALLGYRGRDVLVHRDDLVMMG